jgi:hypothetical protein
MPGLSAESEEVKQEEGEVSRPRDVPDAGRALTGTKLMFIQTYGEGGVEGNVPMPNMAVRGRAMGVRGIVPARGAMRGRGAGTSS